MLTIFYVGRRPDDSGRYRSSATLIGYTHIERNGHHYVNGMQGTPIAEQRVSHEAHEDIYNYKVDKFHLQIVNGKICLNSLETPRLGSSAIPDFSFMQRVKLGR